MQPDILAPTTFAVRVCVTFAANDRHRLFIEINDNDGKICAHIPAGTGAFNHFMPVVSRCPRYNEALASAFEQAGEWHYGGMAELDAEDAWRASKVWPCHTGR